MQKHVKRRCSVQSVEVIKQFTKIDIKLSTKIMAKTNRFFGYLPTFVIATKTADSVEYFGSQFLESVHVYDVAFCAASATP